MTDEAMTPREHLDEIQRLSPLAASDAPEPNQYLAPPGWMGVRGACPDCGHVAAPKSLSGERP